MRTVEIPHQYVERFQAEAEETLKYAAAQLAERLKWRAEARERDEGSVGWDDTVAKHREEVAAADQLYAEAIWNPAEETYAGDGLTVEANAETLRTTIHGCLLEAVDSLKGESEAVGTSATTVPDALAEVDFWRGRLAEFELVVA